VAGLVDYRSFFRVVPAKNPLVWTLHDANPFTGGCHYPGACPRFNGGCGECPELGSAIDSDLSRAIWQRKKAAYSRIPEGRIHVVTPSRWLAGEARRSSLLGRFPVSVIPYGIHTDVFCPRKQIMAREALDIPRDTRVVLFAAASLQERRKGFAMLAEALAPLPADAGIHLVSVGQSAFVPNIRLPNLSLGFIENDRILSLVYSAADVYVTPTLDDNLPNTVMESMSCGTPVVGFEVGGVPDMVRNGVSGFVVPKGDTGALRQAILGVLDDAALRTEMSQNCRRIAVEEYDFKLQARRYLTLYESITSNS
jgi:glycosyltransferase involved in cell wall biosynthesis